MNFDRYVGMASAVGIVLILMIVTWLDLWGPIDLSKLEKWQTLTTGILALIAAGIAYLGATAKVRHDREVLEAENLRRKLALYLKIELALRLLSEKAHEMEGVLVFPPINEDRLVTRESFSITEPPELEEAWTYLDLFPRETIAEIRNIRNCLRKLAVTYNEVGEDKIVWRADTDSPTVIALAQTQLYELWQSASLVVDILEPMIRKMAPEMDTEERIIRLYGEPSGDE
jgi:hypothetical protein